MNRDTLEQEPCDTCEYEEGSIYCREHCPYEAKTEKTSSGDAISRKITTAFLSGLISDETERKKALEYINELPPVNPTKTGHWIFDDNKEHGRCSECGCKEDLVDGHSSYKWCSNCGARMVEPQERSDKE